MREPQRHETIVGEGSGFFISPDGYAVTNNHVVDHASSVQVTTDDGTIYTAKVIGTDPKTDLALIKVDGKSDFPYVKFAEHPPKVGDWVVAVGNPFGLGGTVTAGIVSARGRDIGAGPYDDYIQIDAPINKGNSGGPAFDVDGNVIGVNTAIYSPSGGSVGIGFDIPADTAKMVVAELKKDGHVTRGWLGVQIQPVTRRHRRQSRAEKGRRCDGRRAAKRQSGGQGRHQVRRRHHRGQRHAGQGRPRSRPHHRHDGAGHCGQARHRPSGRADDRVGDAGADAERASRSPATTPGKMQQPSGVPHLGLQVAPAKDVSGAGSEGVVVTGVDPDGPAAEQGFQTGTVILDVGGKAVANAGDVRQALVEAKTQGKHDVLMRVKTGDATRFVAMPLGKA